MLSLGKRRKFPLPTTAEDPPDSAVWPASDAANTRVGAPLAWGIALAAVATVFAIIAIVANYGPLNNAVEQHLVQTELPSSRYDAIGALITASGEACPRVCSIKPEPTLSGPARLDVACARISSPHSCAAPVRYAIAVSRQE